MSEPCARHPHLEAVGWCASCQRPACVRCLVEHRGAERIFCSETCRDSWVPYGGESEPLADEKVVIGEGRPIVTGARLWKRAVGKIALYNAPLAVLAGLVDFLDDPEGTAEAWSSLASIVLGVICLSGVALTGVILSQVHTGLIRDDPYLHTLKRIVPWSLAIGVTFLGIIAFFTIPPSIAPRVPRVLVLLSFSFIPRLFWADEFALVHGMSPWRALKESWALTGGQVGGFLGFQFVLGLAMIPVLIVGSLVPTLFMSFALIPILPMALETETLLLLYAASHAGEISYFYGRLRSPK